MSRSRTFVAFAVVLCLAAAPVMARKKKAPSVSGYVGLDPATPAARIQVVLRDRATGTPVATDTTNLLGHYKFKNVPPGEYVVVCGKVERPVTVVDTKVRLDIDLSEADGVMDYSRNSAGAADGGGAADPGPGDPALMRQMAGNYYSYQGSTERRLTLCPDGRFFLNRESSYSHSGQDMAWGAASQGGASGRWSIQGQPSGGTISFSYSGGGSDRFEYRMVDRGCMEFNGTTYCVQGPPDCG